MTHADGRPRTFKRNLQEIQPFLQKIKNCTMCKSAECSEINILQIFRLKEKIKNKNHADGRPRTSMKNLQEIQLFYQKSKNVQC